MLRIQIIRKFEVAALAASIQTGSPLRRRRFRDPLSDHRRRRHEEPAIGQAANPAQRHSQRASPALGKEGDAGNHASEG